MSLLPSPLAAALAGTGLACFAIGATRRPDPGLKLTGLAVLAFALAPVPAYADQFVEAADNATIDCELARGELTRIALIDDGFANVSKIASGFPYNDFQVTHEPVRGDIYISVPPQFAAARVSFFATSKAGYVYKFACRLGGEEATQLFITNPALAKAAATEWETETGPEDAAIRLIEADYNRSSDTHLIRVPLPHCRGIELYLKDESSHPTGSLKHRLARSLFLYGLCNGWIGEGTTLIEASSGSTAVSEAYFAKLLDLPFIAVVPASTAEAKLEQIRFYGGQIHPVEDPGMVYAESERLAAETGGHYLDQFTYAERATDWRGNNNIAESLFAQLELEEHAIPDWVVMSAGTGGTSATIGRFIRYRGDLSGKTQLCVADPENSVFYAYYQSGDRDVRLQSRSRIEGIGRPRVEASFQPRVIDRMVQVPDAASLATIHWLETVLGRKCGGSTGTNVWACARLAAEMAERGEKGSIVSILSHKRQVRRFASRTGTAMPTRIAWRWLSTRRR